MFSFLSVLTHRKVFTDDDAFKRKVILCAEEASNHAAGRKYTVSAACVHNSQNINAELLSHLTNRKSFPGPRKERNPKNDAEHYQHFIGKSVLHLHSRRVTLYGASCPPCCSGTETTLPFAIHQK